MIIKSLDRLLDRIFSEDNSPEESEVFETSILKLRLERNAMEQMKFAHWMYGEGRPNCIEKVKKLILSSNPDAYFIFNYAQNTFRLNRPENIRTDEFYHLFDYLKELYSENGYKVIESVKESKTENFKYSEIEKYVLVNISTNHLIDLQVVNNHKGEAFILGLGYPVDNDPINGKDPLFFRILKSTF